MKRTKLQKRSLGLLLGLSLLTSAAPGFAENRAGAITVSPYVGGYIFDHEQSYQNLETSPTYGIRAGYNFTENWGAEARFGYSNPDSRLPNGQDAQVLTYGIDALYHFNVTPEFVPFLAAGIGGMHHNFPGRQMGYYPEYAPNYGAGVKYFVTDNIALRGDVRHVILPDNGLNNLEYTAGATFQFGGTKPAVQQAVAVEEAAPVVVAEKDTTPPTVSLTAPGEGATNGDIDRQVSVAFSEAMDPATINGQTFTLQNGTTTVPGTVTNTSATSATFRSSQRLEPGTQYTGRISTGTRDLAGNALPGDYVWNFKTQPVPETKVVTNVVTKTEKEVVVIYKFVMLGQSHFEFDKASLTMEGKEMLKKNVKTMEENPALRVQISGHASAAGSDAYNQELSERRAATAKNYLVQEGGIAPERIETIGFGETRPAQAESDPAILNSEAANANMRIVFEVVQDK
jgi:OOP family OmpA-OmpF porin